MSVKSIDATCLTGRDDYVQLSSTTVHVEPGGKSEGVEWAGRGQEAGEGGALRGLRRAMLAGGERFPEEVFTGGFAIPLGKR